MKKNRIYFGILVLAIILVTAWAAYGMQKIGKTEKNYPVSVIVNNSNSDRWIAFKEGLEQGAADYHIKLNIVSTTEFSDLSEETQTIRREVENGAAGVIVEMQSSQDDEKLLAGLSASGAVTLVETDMTPEDLYGSVMPDSYEIGKAIADAVMEREKPLKNVTIGILSGNQNQVSMQKRLAGFCEAIQESGAKVSWTLSKEQESQYIVAEYQKKSPVDVLITLGNDETERAVDYLQSADAKCRIYGEGCSEKNVYFLDKGMIQTLIVPNEFNMGYQSVAAISKQLEYGTASVENTKIGFLAVTRENLYDEENQKILFPIVQ